MVIQICPAPIIPMLYCSQLLKGQEVRLCFTPVRARLAPLGWVCWWRP